MLDFNNYNKTWITILLITAVLSTLLGSAMVIIDQNYYNGLQYLATALAFFATAYFIKIGKIEFNRVSPNRRTQFMAGFVITVIALGLKGLFWAVGIAVFIISIYNIYKK